MQKQYHPNIHCETMRLRLLLTNYCQLNCKHCLNEYMPKGGEKQNLSFNTVRIITNAYVNKMHNTFGVPTKVYLSGGEPTLNPEFKDIVSYLQNNCDDITLCSNGNNYKEFITSGIYDKITNLHFSFGSLLHFDFINRCNDICKSLSDWKKNRRTDQLVFSIVTNDDPHLEDIIKDMLICSNEYGFKLKLWGDLRLSAEHEINQRYKYLLEKFPVLLHRGPVKHPVNRKSGCKDCTNTCPTLKALWVRPNGTASFCPQADDNKWNVITSSNTNDLIDTAWNKLF
jgi:organic radical activating enzyme